MEIVAAIKHKQLIINTNLEVADFEILFLNLAVADHVDSILFVILKVIPENSRNEEELQYDSTLFLIVVIPDFHLKHQCAL